MQFPNGTILFLNRGKKHGALVGMQGKLCDIPFVVQKVDARSSEAFTKATLAQLGTCSAFQLLK